MTRALSTHGRLLTEQGEFAEAERNIKLSIEVATQLQDSFMICVGREHLGTNLYFQEKLEEATHHYKQSLEYSAALHLDVNEANCYQNLGQVYTDLEQYAAAEAHTRQALAIRLKLGDAYHVNQCFQNLLYMHLNQEQWQEALAVNTEFYQTLETHGMLLDPSLLEPQAYVLDEIREAYAHEVQRWQTIIIALAALLAVLITAVVWRWRVLHKRAQALQHRLEAAQLAIRRAQAAAKPHTHPSGQAFAERMQPLLAHKNELLAPCYALLAAGATVTRIASTLNRSRRRVHQYIMDIAEVLDIPPEQVKEDAIYYGHGPEP